MPLILIALSYTIAQAAEVVWIGQPTPADAERVLAAAENRGAPLTPLDLRAAATRWTARDDAAYNRIDEALRDVRQYEARLDGELLIMSELDGPVADIGIIRDERDRARLFAALAYQGFAVDRLFDDELATDDRAGAYRLELNGAVLARPWVHAVAIAPDRNITAYEVAEAPQRIAYEDVRQSVRAALPALLVPSGLPATSRLVVDGRTAEIGASGSVKVPPGRHLIHVEVDGRVLARWDVTAGSAERVALDVPLTDAAFDTWLAAIAAGGAPDVPEPLRPSIEALGGAVWIATGSGDGVQAWVVTPTSVAPAPLSPPEPTIIAPPEPDGALSFSAGLLAGWLSSGDFYLQDPTVPRTMATVNAPTTGAGLSADLDAGSLRISAGLDATVTLGEHHAAKYGDGETRLRVHPHLAAGVAPAQVTLGYLFPHHPAVGARAAIPLGRGSGLELHARASWGIPTSRARSDGSTWRSDDVFALSMGLGWRARP